MKIKELIKIVLVIILVLIILIILCIGWSAIRRIKDRINTRKMLSTDQITVKVIANSGKTDEYIIDEIHITDKDIINDIVKMFVKTNLREGFKSVWYIRQNIEIDFNNGTTVYVQSNSKDFGSMNGKFIYLPEGFVDYIENIILNK